MIEFEINDIEEMYTRLLSPRQKVDELEKLIEQLDDQSSSDLKKRLGKRSPNYESSESGKIFLPPPLKYVNFLLYSNGINYRGNALFPINFSNFEDYNVFEERVVKSYQALENAQVIGQNAIILYGTDPFFSISLEPSLHFFEVKFGEGGTMKRRLSGIEHFETDMTKFISLVSQFINGCLYDQKDVPNIKYRIYLK